jgi:hypothetical protein
MPPAQQIHFSLLNTKHKKKIKSYAFLFALEEHKSPNSLCSIFLQ